MNYSIKTYRCFDKGVKQLAKRYKSLKADLASLAHELLQNPESGTDLGGGLHKVRSFFCPNLLADGGLADNL